jgi:hypothetical protein
MVGHTGYLVSARCLGTGVDGIRWQSKERQRYRARQKMQEEIEQEEARRSTDATSGARKYPRLPLPD